MSDLVKRVYAAFGDDEDGEPSVRVTEHGHYFYEAGDPYGGIGAASTTGPGRKVMLRCYVTNCDRMAARNGSDRLCFGHRQQWYRHRKLTKLQAPRGPQGTPR